MLHRFTESLVKGGNLEEFKLEIRNYETADKTRSPNPVQFFPRLQNFGNKKLFVLSNYWESRGYRYSLRSLSEARAFLGDDYLNNALSGLATDILLNPVWLQNDGDHHDPMFESTHNLVWSSMTLFSRITGADSIFAKIIFDLYCGEFHEPTLNLLDQLSQPQPPV